jgi:hypothetical protein
LLDDARHWSERAREARAAAEAVHDMEGKRALLEIAESYDRLAERALTRFNEYPQ